MQKTSIINLLFRTLPLVILSVACVDSEDRQPKPEETKAAKSATPTPVATVKPRSTGSIKNVTTTLNNEPGLEGSLAESILSEAIINLDELTKKEPDNVPLHVTYLSFLRMYGQNHSLYDSVERKIGLLAFKNVWFELESAYSAMKRKEFSRADYLLEKAEKNAGTDPLLLNAALHARALRQLLTGKIREGVLLMRRSAKGSQAYYPSLLTLGFIQLRAGDIIGAEEIFRSAIAIMPDSAYATIGLAASLRAKGKGDEAVSILRSLYKLRANDRRIAYNFALALSESIGNGPKEALEIMKKYFQLPGMYAEIDSKANDLFNKLQALNNNNDGASKESPK